MSAPLPCCKCCEHPAVVLSEVGLCPLCAAHPALVAAYREGLARLAETAARAATEGGAP
jgi:hypothetical protein